MEKEELLKQTSDTENVETQTTEENVEGIELTDTSDVEVQEEQPTEEKEEVKKTLRDLLKENPEYQEEFNGMIQTRLDRKDREHQKELSKYIDTENVLKKTLGANDTQDVNKKLREYYESEGVDLPSVYEPGLSAREVEVLARDEASQIIEDGYEAMMSEANKLASKGYENLNSREKVIFLTLSDKINEEKDRKELLKLGAKEELLSDAEFTKFRKQFTNNVPIETIYNLYKGKETKPKIENPGSMRNSLASSDIKEFYTPEEASKFTRSDYDKNPKLLEAVEYSMTQWKK